MSTVYTASTARVYKVKSRQEAIGLIRVAYEICIAKGMKTTPANVQSIIKHVAKRYVDRSHIYSFRWEERKNRNMTPYDRSAPLTAKGRRVNKREVSSYGAKLSSIVNAA